ncbi:MAG: hypothetical protein ABJG42_24150 [Vibrio splendidus]
MDHIFFQQDSILLRIPIVDEMTLGTPIKSATYSVYNMENALIVPPTDLPLDDVLTEDFEPFVTLEIAYDDRFSNPENQLKVANSPRVYYKLVAVFTAESGVVHRHINEFYVEDINADLSPPHNSFAKLGYLMSIATMRSNMDCFMDATFDARLTALMQAFSDITTVPMFLGTVPLIEAFKKDPSVLSDDDLFAVSLAQVIQASYILGGSPIEARRQWGLVSGTAGESSQFYRSAKPFTSPVCADAYQPIKKYISYSRRIGRS